MGSGTGTPRNEELDGHRCHVAATGSFNIWIRALRARVASTAGSGEILVSRTVRDLPVGSEVAFEDRGSHELKGVNGDGRLYAVT
jgi:hypothetical protein